MEVQGRAGKTSKWICTVACRTSLYILGMEKQLSSSSTAIYAFIIHCKRSEFLNGNCTQITQGNISKMEKDLKGLISKTDYLIYMLLALSFKLSPERLGSFTSLTFDIFFSVKDSSYSEAEKLFK